VGGRTAGPRGHGTHQPDLGDGAAQGPFLAVHQGLCGEERGERVPGHPGTCRRGRPQPCGSVAGSIPRGRPPAVTKQRHRAWRGRREGRRDATWQGRGRGHGHQDMAGKRTRCGRTMWRGLGTRGHRDTVGIGMRHGARAWRCARAWRGAVTRPAQGRDGYQYMMAWHKDTVWHTMGMRS